MKLEELMVSLLDDEKALQQHANAQGDLVLAVPFHFTCSRMNLLSTSPGNMPEIRNGLIKTHLENIRDHCVKDRLVDSIVEVATEFQTWLEAFAKRQGFDRVVIDVSSARFITPGN